MKNENLNFNETQKLYLESFFDCVYEAIANIQSVNNMTRGAISNANKKVCLDDVKRSLKILDGLTKPLLDEMVELSCNANYLTLDKKEKNAPTGLWDNVDTLFNESLKVNQKLQDNKI